MNASETNVESKVRTVWPVYALLLIGGTLTIGLLLHIAPENHLVDGSAMTATTSVAASDIGARLREPLVILLLQILSIVTLATLAGKFARRLGQPSVFGEIIVGILLGPSLFGWAAPAGQQWLFPSSSMDSLRLLSQLGIVIFLFGSGAEINVASLRRYSMHILLVSHASIILPFTLGVGCAFWFYAAYTPPHGSFVNFALLMGVAMSITAFPVLVRILRERGLAGTQTGDMATACAAMTDVTAWCLLICIIAISQASSASSALVQVGMTLVFCAVLLGVVRPRLSRLRFSQRHTGSAIAFLALFALASATAAELIGVHALFGAFVAGATVASHPDLRATILEKIEPLPLALLLPLFFAFTGLRTHINMLNGQDWLVCGGIVALATVGKFGGASLAARLAGSSWRDACVLGILMNTRGAMELVVLNIGYDLGLLSDRAFAILVLMTLITTFATGPLLNLKIFSNALHPPDRAPLPESVTANYSTVAPDGMHHRRQKATLRTVT